MTFTVLTHTRVRGGSSGHDSRHRAGATGAAHCTTRSTATEGAGSYKINTRIAEMGVVIIYLLMLIGYVNILRQLKDETLSTVFGI